MTSCVGVIGAWERVEANASARKHAAVAELLRRRPAPGAPVDGASGLPGEWDEFVSRELGAALALSAGDAEEVLALAAALEVSVPGTRAAFRSGVLTRDKALIIASATMLLDPAEARAAEAMVLDRAGSLTPAGLRSAISRAVMQVNPEKAKQTAGAFGEAGAGGAVGGAVRERGPDRPGAAARPTCWPLISGSPGGPGSCAWRAWTAAWICSAPAPSWTFSSASTPAP